jgi:hypothetical protein
VMSCYRELVRSVCNCVINFAHDSHREGLED